MRVDSGFWANDTIAALNRLERALHDGGARRRTKGIATAIAAIPDDARGRRIEYTDDGEAKSPKRLHDRHRQRQRDAPTDRAPHPAHRPAATDDCGPTGDTTRSSPTSTVTPSTVDQFHRQHAVVELAIRDLKEGAGLEHVPSGQLPRQLGLAAMRRPRPQHDPLDRRSSARSASTTNSSSPAPSAPDSSPSPAGSSTAPDNQHCACRPTGHGPTPFTTALDRAPRTCNPPPADHHRPRTGAPHTNTER